MKTASRTLEVQREERQKAVELKHSFLIDSINDFIEDRDVFEVLGSLRRVKMEWLNPETADSKDAQKSILSNLHAIESLLLDIAEANAKGAQLILDSYEQAPE